MPKSTKTVLRWTDDRAEELQELRKLLCDVALLNNGSRFIENVQACIKIAERLSAYTLEGRKSFLEFLHAECITDREAHRDQTSARREK